MFKRSIKYMVLVAINIVLITLFMIDDPVPEDVFDTAYVISILDDKTKLDSQVKKLNEDKQVTQEQSASLQTQLDQTRSLMQQNIDALSQCSAERDDYTVLVQQQAQLSEQQQTTQLQSQQQCSDGGLKLAIAEQNVARLKQGLEQSLRDNRAANERLLVLERELSSVVGTEEKHALTEQNLVDTISRLEKDLMSDIYIKKIYATPVYCEKPRFEELVCLERLLVRPEFSKKSASDIEVQLVAPSGRVVSEFRLDAAKAKLVDFTFSNNNEQSAGIYGIKFNVDGIELSEKIAVGQ